MKPGRQKAMQVPCPKCKALMYEPCVSKRGARKAVHRERIQDRAETVWLDRPGTKTAAAGFYSSEEWIALRYKALARHGNRCQCCGASPSTGAVIHVDHIKPRSKFPELALDLDNLQILCRNCNVGKSNKDATDWRVAS